MWSKWKVTAVLTGALLLVLTFVQVVPAFNQDHQVKAIVDADKNTITVSGSGELKVAPDIATLTVSVQTKGETAKSAQAANAAEMASVQKVLYTDYKLAKKDVKSGGFTVYPEYVYEANTTPKITGYVATHTLQIVYRNIPNIGTFLDSLTANGINQVGGIQFGTEKQQAYELQAIELAMANAKAKAVKIAATEGRKVKTVLQVTQQSTNYPSWSNPIYSKVGAVADKSVETSIAEGEISLSTSVTVTYQF
ncbi:MAG: hypothetical protein RLZZ267_1232 [Bacillota bacterium]|jgi:uncharacterized protein YggE